eukprot:6180192-Pleurochrysis_carterae.AAC.1
MLCSPSATTGWFREDDIWPRVVCLLGGQWRRQRVLARSVQQVCKNLLSTASAVLRYLRNGAGGGSIRGRRCLDRAIA